jgi:hypothetical protein
LHLIFSSQEFLKSFPLISQYNSSF